MKHPMFPVESRVVLIESGARGRVEAHVRASRDDYPAKKAHRVRWDSFGSVSYVRPGRLRLETAEDRKGPCCSNASPTLDESVDARSESDRWTILCSHCQQELGRISETVGPALEGLYKGGPAPASAFATPHLTRRLVSIGFVTRANGSVTLTERGRLWCKDQFGG